MGLNRKIPSNAVWRTFGNAGEPMHFYSANGFAAGVYTPFLTLLSQKYRLSALEMRAVWPDTGLPPRTKGWRIYADDLIGYLDSQYDEPVIGLGHSMGATATVLAADKRPDLFKALVLIEPAMVSRPIASLARLLPKSVMNHTRLAKSTLSKPDRWPTRKEYETYIRKFKGYRRFDDAAFSAMADHGVIRTADGDYTLAFPKLWEAHNYTCPPNVFALIQRIKLPCVAIRANPSLFFTASWWEEWQTCSPDTIFKEDLNYGHLMPLENPRVCFELVEAGLAAIDPAVT